VGGAGGGYDPRRYLQGLIAEAWGLAVDNGQAVHVQGPWPAISLYPDSLAAVIEGGEDVLREFAGEPDVREQARLVFSPAPRFRISHPDMVAIDVLMWKLALGASRGRLPIGVSVETPYSMREWPNFTRLLVTPGALAVTALWTQRACSIRQTIHELGLAPSDVHVFYSAAAATGFVVRDDGPLAGTPSTAAPFEPASPFEPRWGPAPPGTPAGSPIGPPSLRRPTPAAPRRGLLRTLFDKLRSN
jgi:hypothetical protein